MINLKELNDNRIFFINQFGEWKIDIDFNEPEQSQNKLIDYTISVEEECPVAKHFGVEKGTGEGIVWTCNYNGIVYRMKVKGELHSTSKVKILAPVDIERVNSINELVCNVVTENRLLQGLDHLRENNIELSIENTGSFIKWVNGDIVKEEIDLIIGSNFEIKEVMAPASKKAKAWFFDKIFSDDAN